MTAYLDNSATTKPTEAVVDEMARVMREAWGNPSAMHGLGVQAENEIKQSRERIARTLGAKPSEIIFTSGGTESNNMLINGIARIYARRGRHIITTAIEHPAVANPMKRLADEGYEFTVLGVDARGRIDTGELAAAVRDDTILVSIMHVNNEIGTIEPIEETARVIHDKNPDTVFHVDAIQSYGKLPINPKRMGVDALSVSGHKLHAPKGIGFLYLREGLRIEPLLLGGGQERDLRSGTENVPAIVGLGIAAEELCRGQKEHLAQLSELRQMLIDGLSDCEGVSFNGAYDSDDGLPAIVSISVEGVRAEVLLHALEEKDIYVSAGSACSSHHKHESATLAAIGLPQELRESTIRASFSVFTTEDEVRYAAEAMRELIPQLRRFRRH